MFFCRSAPQWKTSSAINLKIALMLSVSRMWNLSIELLFFMDHQVQQPRRNHPLAGHKNTQHPCSLCCWLTSHLRTSRASVSLSFSAILVLLPPPLHTSQRRIIRFVLSHCYPTANMPPALSSSPLPPNAPFPVTVDTVDVQTISGFSVLTVNRK